MEGLVLRWLMASHQEPQQMRCNGTAPRWYCRPSMQTCSHNVSNSGGNDVRHTICSTWNLQMLLHCATPPRIRRNDDEGNSCDAIMSPTPWFVIYIRNPDRSNALYTFFTSLFNSWGWASEGINMPITKRQHNLECMLIVRRNTNSDTSPLPPNIVMNLSAGSRNIPNRQNSATRQKNANTK